MAKINPYDLNPKKRNKILDEFYLLILSLRTKRQVLNFFKDALTASETLMLARRIQIAKRILRGYSYDEIINDLKVGPDTINRVQIWLKDGLGDYIKSFKKIIKSDRVKSREEVRKEADPNSLSGLANRYPLYFELIDEIYQELHESRRGRRSHKKL